MTNTNLSMYEENKISHLKELRRSYAEAKCKETAYYEQTLSDENVQYIENASQAENHRANPILPVGYRDKETGEIRAVVSSRQCSDDERDKVFWERYAAREWDKFPFDNVEPLYFTPEQIADLRAGELKESIDSFFQRVRNELPPRYKKEAERCIDELLAGFETAPISFDELRRDTDILIEATGRVFFQSVADARAKYTTKKYRRSV